MVKIKSKNDRLKNQADRPKPIKQKVVGLIALKMCYLTPLNFRLFHDFMFLFDY